MDWAVAQGHKVDNPAGDALRAVLPKNVGTRHRQRALHHSEVRGAVELVRDSERAWPLTKLCFEFMTLTAARSGEARGAHLGRDRLETQSLDHTGGPHESLERTSSAVESKGGNRFA